MDQAKVYNFLNSITESNIGQKKILNTLEKLACFGCGKGRECIVSCNVCDVCKDDPQLCQEKSQCEDCRYCDCPDCYSEWNDGVEYDDSYTIRIKKLNKILKSYIVSSYLDISLWLNNLPTSFILNEFSYIDHKDIWRKYIFNNPNIQIPLSYIVYGLQYDDISIEDKIYFLTKEQQEKKNTISYANSYNLLRIMSGLPGLNYTN